jgi:hypothetical protein
MKIIQMIMMMVIMTGCTISMNMVNTKGTASDVIDETQAPTNDIKADVSVPVKPL